MSENAKDTKKQAALREQIEHHPLWNYPPEERLQHDREWQQLYLLVFQFKEFLSKIENRLEHTDTNAMLQDEDTLLDARYTRRSKLRTKLDTLTFTESMCKAVSKYDANSGKPFLAYFDAIYANAMHESVNKQSMREQGDVRLTRGEVDESKKESYCDACVTALIHLMKYTAPSTDDPKAFCLDLIQLQLTLHLTLYPNFVSSKFVIACAALAELYPLSAKEFAKPVLQMAEKFHSFNTFDLKQIGFGRRRQVSDLPKCLQDLCLFFYSEISVYWSLAVTAESNAERQLIARAAIKKASTLAYLPCHADIDLKLLDLIHIAYTDGIQKSDLYRYDSQTFNIIISGETGELLCKYDES